MRYPPIRTVRFRSEDLRALDADASGAVTARDVLARLGALCAELVGHDGESHVVVPLSSTPHDVGRAARIFAYAKATVRSRAERPAAPEGAAPHEQWIAVEHIDVPHTILVESAP